MSARAIGWDIHQKFSMVSVRELRDDGELVVVERQRLRHEERTALHHFLGRQPPGTPVAIEATFGWPWVADLLTEFGLEPHLAHPPAVRVMAKHQAKTDRCDADRLGEFYLLGKLPESYLAPPEVRQLRERIRYRMALSGLRQGVKNRVHALLHRRGVTHGFSDLFGAGGQAFLQTLTLPEASQEVLRGYLRLLEQIRVQLEEVERWMLQHIESDVTTRLLTSIPGIGLILAHVLVSEIGQIERFPSHRHLASYVGLAPLADDSAGRHGRRHTSPACNHTLRWAFVEASHVVASRCERQAPRLCQLYKRLSHGGRDCKGEAHVAVAREICKLVYVVWSKRQPYCVIPPPRPGALPPAATVTVSPRRQRFVRAGQPGHPMVRHAAKTAGQTLL